MEFSWGLALGFHPTTLTQPMGSAPRISNVLFTSGKPRQAGPSKTSERARPLARPSDRLRRGPLRKLRFLRRIGPHRSIYYGKRPAKYSVD